MSLQLSRLSLYFLLLIFTVIYQVRYPLFINADFLLPLYSFIFLALAITSLFLFFGKKALDIQRVSLKVLLPIDAICITCILYKTGLQNSLYLFFYLYLIFITALSFRLKGAIYFSIFCSILLSAILLLDTNTDSNSKTILFLINNVAFFVVAYLSGTLSEQLFDLGEQVQVKDKNIQNLKNINTIIVDHMKTGLIHLGPQQNPGTEPSKLGTELPILQTNKAALEILKTSKLSESDDLFKLLGDFKSRFKGKSLLTQELQVVVENKPIMLEVLISELKDQTGDYGYLLLFQDISERKVTEERLKNQEKLAAVGQLAAGIAHEIRNPLASMSGSIQLLADSFGVLEDDQKKLIAITLKETDRLNLLITEFLEFVRPNFPLDDSINIKKLIEECVDILKLSPQVPPTNVTLQVEDVKAFAGNRDKLKQVFLNILINSAQASSKNITVTVAKIDSEIHIAFKDDGLGMKDSVRVKIFEPFFTTKPRGSGLGLAIVHKIIESHGGRISVASEVGKGTEFKIQIPVT